MIALGIWATLQSLIVLFLLVIVIPQFRQFYEDFATDRLDGTTVRVLMIGDSFWHYWYLVLPVLLSGPIGLVLFLKRPTLTGVFIGLFALVIVATGIVLLAAPGAIFSPIFTTVNVIR